MADKPNDNQVISYDVDFLEAFISRLTEVIDGFETPAKHVAGVRTAFDDAASTGTNGHVVAKVFRPLSGAVDTAVGKIEHNLEALVQSLENDRNALRRLVDAVRHTESESAHSIRQVGQTLSRHEVYT